MKLQVGYTQDSNAAFGRAEPDAYPMLPDRTHETTARSTDSTAAGASRLQRGHVLLDSTLLRQLRLGRLMSQQDLADDCWRRNIPLSLTTIKRAELGRAVRFRIAREFARCFEVPLMRVLRIEDAVAVLACHGNRGH
ncbi:MAG: hypothetical protein JNN30_14940 [Rhodanobacteraceae bacterium]|nr:hypothetical protein [Rhodanobacteraceae bacterium]